MICPSWSGKIVESIVDNKAVVEVLKVIYCNDLHFMDLIRVLIFFTCKYDFWLTVFHIPGRLNEATDAIPRNNYIYICSFYRSQR